MWVTGGKEGTLNSQIRKGSQKAIEVKETNSKILKRIKTSGDASLDIACWEKSKEEEKKGWISGLRPLEARDCEALVLTPRLAVRQLSNSGKWKTRVIDDLKASRVNETISLSGVYRPEPIECLLGAAKCWAKADPSAKLKVWSIDFEGAYKHIPLNASENDVSHIVFVNRFETNPM